jgi:DNA-binding beta-propeller fold protein YncE
MTKKIFYLTILLFITQFVNAQPDKELGRASIQPSIAKLNRGDQQKFKVIKMATPLRSATLATNVKWYVNNIKGGNKKIGTIDANGLYTAPDKLPSPREIHIIGKTEGVTNTQLFATVLIETDEPVYEMVYEFTEPIKTAQYFTNPHCVTLDKAGNLIIADYTGSRVLRFTPEGKYLGDLGLGKGNEPGQIYKPRVVKCDDKGDIYVSDQKPFGDRIQVFSHDGKLLRSFGAKGSGSGEILRGHGIDFDKAGLLYTIDVDAMRVNIYTKGGEFVKSWGKDGPYREDFNASHGLIVDPNDDVFISGYYGALQKFDKDGRFLKTAFESDPPDGSVYIHSIADDKWGNVYAMVRGSRGYGGEIEVTEGKVVSMEKYNNNGDYVGALSLAVKAHAENWVYVDDKGYLYFIFRSKEKMGFEIFKPL